MLVSVGGFMVERMFDEIVPVSGCVTEPTSGQYVPEGTYRRRVVGVAGDFSDWVTVTCGEVVG